MGTKSILLAVAEPQTLVDITQALGHGWEATSVSSEADALAQLEQRSFDALLVDFNLGSPDASQLLACAAEKRPETTRFLLAYEADLALVAAYVSGPHEILPKPVDPASLKHRIESGVAPQDPASVAAPSDPGTAPNALPAVPAVYAEVLKALDVPGVTARQVGELVAADAALTAEVLRLTESAYLGLPCHITDPVEAVDSLGLETVKALVMALRFLAEHSQSRPGYLSLDKLWAHSVEVARLARDLTLFETRDRELAAEALVAGLLHDLGKVVLATNFDDLYGRVHSLGRKQPVPMWDIEKEMFGASHGEIGACLVGMWNMPGSVVQAAAFHHEPPLGEYQQLTPLAAVHIANVLAYELRPGDEFRVAPVPSPAFLNEIGLLQRLPVWRAVFANRQAAGTNAEVRPVELCQPQPVTPVSSGMPVTVNQPTAGSSWTRTATSGRAANEMGMRPAPAFRRGRWAYAVAAAVILGFLGLWLQPQPELPVRALTRAPSPAKAPVAVALPESVPAAVHEGLPFLTVPEEGFSTAASTDTKLVPLVPNEEPINAAVPEATAPITPPAHVAPQEPAQPSFRVNGIIYTVARPVAIVNGQTVYVGDHVSGATVVGISRTQVTLQMNGQRKTCILE